MKKILLICTFTMLFMFAACNAGSESNGVKIVKWGPLEPLKIGTIPNKQPDGKMGLWIDVESTEGMGEIQILFEGRPQPTAVQPKLVTAGIDPSDISAAGDKKIEIKMVSTGQIILVGTLKVIP